SWKNPPPGTVVKGEPDKDHQLAQKVEDLHDPIARSNFRVVVIKPDEVEQTDISDPATARRYRYTFDAKAQDGNEPPKAMKSRAASKWRDIPHPANKRATPYSISRLSKMLSGSEITAFSISFLVLVTFINFIILIPVLAIYRLFFHPVAKFPGPKLAAATKWYEFYFDIIKAKGKGGQFAEEIRKMHMVYGPIIRINPDEVHVQDPEWYDTLYASNPTRRDKWPPAAQMVGLDLAAFGTVEHVLHGKRRAALSSLFSGRSVSNAEPGLSEQTQILSDVFQKHLTSGSIVELRTVCVSFTTDAVFQFALNESMELQKNPTRADKWRRTLVEFTKITPLVKQFAWSVALSRRIPLGVLRKLQPDMAGLLQMQQDIDAKAYQYLEDEERGRTKQTTSEKGSTSRTGRPVFQSICQSNLPASEKAVYRLGNECTAVIVAGGETTSRVLMLGMFHILNDPSIAHRLQEELDVAIPDVEKAPALKTLERLPFLNSVIKEVLRITGLVTSRLPLTCPTEMRYRGWVIPARVSIFTKQTMSSAGQLAHESQPPADRH
ncbi:MAG: hypothetical protein Q9174_005927, partial [Haloplaca sp. 1 TL-2023]